VLDARFRQVWISRVSPGFTMFAVTPGAMLASALAD
jgi:hypothetical protein